MPTDPYEAADYRFGVLMVALLFPTVVYRVRSKFFVWWGVVQFRPVKRSKVTVTATPKASDMFKLTVMADTAGQ